MNLFAVNAAEVNGSIEVWGWYGDAALSVNASGELMVGLTLSGDAQVVTTSSLEPQMRAIPSLVASDIQMSAAGEAIYGRAGEGSALIVVSAAGEGRRWTFGEGAGNIVFEADGDAQVLQPAAGNFTIVIDTTLDADVRSTVIEPGYGAIVIVGTLDNKVARPHFGEGVVEIHMASVGSGHLIIDGPAAGAEVALLADGAARLGDRVFGEGEAAIELYARGSLSSMHYEYGEGSAVIVVMAAALAAGIPIIPSEYNKAPAARTITVQRGDREFEVPGQNRRIA